MTVPPIVGADEDGPLRKATEDERVRWDDSWRAPWGMDSLLTWAQDRRVMATRYRIRGLSLPDFTVDTQDARTLALIEDAARRHGVPLERVE